MVHRLIHISSLILIKLLGDALWRLQWLCLKPLGLEMKQGSVLRCRNMNWKNGGVHYLVRVLQNEITQDIPCLFVFD